MIKISMTLKCLRQLPCQVWWLARDTRHTQTFALSILLNNLEHKQVKVAQKISAVESEPCCTDLVHGWPSSALLCFTKVCFSQSTCPTSSKAATVGQMTRTYLCSCAVSVPIAYKNTIVGYSWGFCSQNSGRLFQPRQQVQDIKIENLMNLFTVVFISFTNQFLSSMTCSDGGEQRPARADRKQPLDRRDPRGGVLCGYPSYAATCCSRVQPQAKQTRALGIALV